MPDIVATLLRLTIILAAGQAFVLAFRRIPAWVRVLVLRITLLGAIACCVSGFLGVRLVLPVLPAEKSLLAQGTPVSETEVYAPMVLGGDVVPPPPAPAAPVWPMAVWGAGAGLLGLALLLSWLKLQGLRRAASPLSLAEDQILLNQASRREVELGRQKELGTALTFGLARHTVLVPDSYRTWSPELRRSVLYHEAAHIRRLDCAWNTLALAFRAAAWLHPLAWTLAASLRHESELAADEMAMAMGVSPLQYAESLLSLAKSSVPGASSPQGAITMSTHPLGRRIRAALKPARRFSRLGAIALATVTALLFLGAAAAYAGPREDPAQTLPKDPLPAASSSPTAVSVSSEESGPVKTRVDEKTRAAIQEREAQLHSRLLALSQVMGEEPAPRKATAQDLKKERDALKARRDALKAQANDPKTKKLLKEIESLRREIASLEKKLGTRSRYASASARMGRPSPDAFQLKLSDAGFSPEDMKRLMEGMALSQEQMTALKRMQVEKGADFAVKSLPKIETRDGVLFIDGQKIVIPDMPEVTELRLQNTKALKEAQEEMVKARISQNAESLKALKDAQSEMARAKAIQGEEIAKALKEAQSEMAKARADQGEEIAKALKEAQEEMAKARAIQGEEMAKALKEAQSDMARARVELEKAQRDRGASMTVRSGQNGSTIIEENIAPGKKRITSYTPGGKKEVIITQEGGKMTVKGEASATQTSPARVEVKGGTVTVDGKPVARASATSSGGAVTVLSSPSARVKGEASSVVIVSKKGSTTTVYRARAKFGTARPSVKVKARPKVKAAPKPKAKAAAKPKAAPKPKTAPKPAPAPKAP